MPPLGILRLSAPLAKYLMAFGLSRHRAWVVGQRALKSQRGLVVGLSGASWRYFGGFLGAVLDPLGAWFGPLGSLLGASWETLQSLHVYVSQH